jgi:hypothetical protein
MAYNKRKWARNPITKEYDEVTEENQNGMFGISMGKRMKLKDKNGNEGWYQFDAYVPPSQRPKKQISDIVDDLTNPELAEPSDT